MTKNTAYGDFLPIQFEVNKFGRKFGQNFEVLGQIFIRNIWSPGPLLKRKHTSETTLLQSVYCCVYCLVQFKRLKASGEKFLKKSPITESNSALGKQVTQEFSNFLYSDCP